MIVTYTDRGFEIVLQRHHGRLAAAILNQLKWLEADPFKLDVLFATGIHDDTYNEFEVEGIINRFKGPKDFKMESFNLQRCEALLKKGLTRSLYVALLLSFHIQFLYATESDESAQYCKSLQPLQHKWMAELGIDRNTVQAHYAILQWCDALSLILCQDQIPPEGRKLEVSQGPEARSYYVFDKSGSILSVDPWPFTDNEFELTLEYRILPRLEYQNDAVFKESLWESTVHFRKINFAKI
ncbi:DUF3891 family protein [Olivibacter sp. SA151]|uniref:DUF3891 domain-containing protein n=1 Tax=Sphingobacterium sp. (strain 21) TaxID=743722 RepID=F4CBD4_SPHS2